MNERYSRISTLTDSLYIPNCPIIISNGALLKDNKDGKLIGQLKFLNTSEKSIKTISIQLDYFDADGKLIEKSPIFEYPEAQVPEGEFFGQKTPIPIFNSKTKIIYPKIKSITFSNKEKIDYNDCEYKKLPKQDELSSVYNQELVQQYKVDVYNEAKYIPISFDSLWVCTCGAINQISNHKCIKCATQKDKQFLGLDHDTLYSNRQKAIEKERIAQNHIKYNQACQKMSTIKINDFDKISELEKAMKEFESILDWKDSKEKIEQCKNKIDEIKKERERILIEAEREKKRRKKTIIITIASIIVISFAIILISNISHYIKHKTLYEAFDNNEFTTDYVIQNYGYGNLQKQKGTLKVIARELHSCYKKNDLKKALDIINVLAETGCPFKTGYYDSTGNNFTEYSNSIHGTPKFSTWLYEAAKKEGKQIFLDGPEEDMYFCDYTYDVHGYKLTIKLSKVQSNNYPSNGAYLFIPSVGWYEIACNYETGISSVVVN